MNKGICVRLWIQNLLMRFEVNNQKDNLLTPQEEASLQQHVSHVHRKRQKVTSGPQFEWQTLSICLQNENTVTVSYYIAIIYYSNMAGKLSTLNIQKLIKSYNILLFFLVIHISKKKKTMKDNCKDWQNEFINPSLDKLQV